ncbi:zinc dependent phospholipase C family protein [Heyndrickxia oleronia]|uniref:Hydrolase n=1 Tax=Heyndrickxia oleronia TaxID=38875 RepID=A0A8E2I469_9BACI|nr:zinc dependent phospholipase C family protein [Heyndrickxia oleronia]MEC1375811.1 zinc dependent phospholipase C family protein [Heyndrickxia oleronia]OOP65838.1 hydrolase [Heyndrickxia oleronia]QQZ02826.1 hydrolase [Heyndrickxia oleronia]
MGSRIMHLIIAEQIANKISISNKEAFILGGVAPDAVTSKEISHFYIGNLSDFTRSIDFNGFFENYKEMFPSDYLLGYYIHLIADDLWLKGFYMPWLKNRMENDESILELYHNDFRLLNGKLLNFYHINDVQIHNTDTIDEICDLNEVHIEDIKAFLPFLYEDIQYEEAVLDENLNVFTFNQIIGYIETSIEKALYHLKDFDLVLD